MTAAGQNRAQAVKINGALADPLALQREAQANPCSSARQSRRGCAESTTYGVSKEAAIFHGCRATYHRCCQAAHDEVSPCAEAPAATAFATANSLRFSCRTTTTLARAV